MSVRDLFRRTDDAAPVANRREIISRYKTLREVSQKLNQEMVERLADTVLDEGARKLGFLQGNTLVFNSEDETSVLMDYCIYDVRRKGRNAIEQYLIESPPDPESDEMACLRAMQDAIYSLFIVESVDRGLGINVRDLLSNDILLVVDLGLSKSAQPGLIFASRLVFHDGYAATGGAALPISVVPPHQQDAATKELMEMLPESDGFFDPADLIRSCLSLGCSSNIQYDDPTGGSMSHQRGAGISGPATSRRNDPCPCGSGKKYKKCCLRK